MIAWKSASLSRFSLGIWSGGGGTSLLCPRHRPWVRRGRGLRLLRPPLPLTCRSTVAAFVPPKNGSETQLKSWQRRQMGGNPIWSCCFKLYLRQGGFCETLDNGELCWRRTGWFSVSEWGHQIPGLPLCSGPGQTFYLEAFLNLSRGRNVTHGPVISPKIFQSLKNFWADIPWSFSKSGLGRCKSLSFDRCVNTAAVLWTLQMWLRCNRLNRKRLKTPVKNHFSASEPASAVVASFVGCVSASRMKR